MELQPICFSIFGRIDLLPSADGESSLRNGGGNAAVGPAQSPQQYALSCFSCAQCLKPQADYGRGSQTDTSCFSCLARFWYDLRLDYPAAEVIYVVVDNWPVHFHPDVLAPLQEQYFPFQPRLPANWPTAPSPKAKVDDLPIRLLTLPTYASWLNPIQKLWRWLKQDILHLHRYSDDWPGLKQRVDHFLADFSHGSNKAQVHRPIACLIC